MSWAVKNNNSNEIKELINKPFSFSELLMKVNVFTLACTTQDFLIKTEIREYVQTNIKTFLKTLIQTILESTEVGVAPIRIREMLQSLDILNCLMKYELICWSGEIMRQYVNCLFESFFKGFDYNSISHHGYFETIFLFICNNDKIPLLNTALQEEQNEHKIIERIFAHSDKLSITNCLGRILLIDMKLSENICFSLKKLIILEIFNVFEGYFSGFIEESESKVENLLDLFVEFYGYMDRFYDNVAIQQEISLRSEIIIKLAIQASHSTIRLKALCMLHEKEKWVKILTKESKMLEQIEKKAGIITLPSILEEPLVLKALINRFFQIENMSVEVVYLLRCFTIILRNRSQREEGMNIIINSELIKEIYQKLFNYPKKNIYSAAVLDFIYFCLNYSKKEEKIRFTFDLDTSEINFNFCFLENLKEIEENIQRFEHFSEPLFHFSSEVSKVLRIYANDCEMHLKDKIIETNIFKKWKMQLNKWIYFNNFDNYHEYTKPNLGNFETEGIIVTTTTFIVTKAVQNINTIIQPFELPILLASFEVPNREVSTCLGSKVTQNEIKIAFSPRSIKKEISPLKELINNQEELEESYEAFIKKRMNKIDQEVDFKKESKSSSRIKSEKKKISRWELSPKSKSNQKPLFNIANDLDLKLMIIRLRSWQYPKVVRKRLLNEKTDKEIIKLLNAKSIKNDIKIY